MLSIVDYGRKSPSISPVFNAAQSFYWTSTSTAVGGTWVVGFDFDAATFPIGAGGLNSLRAVRGGS